MSRMLLSDGQKNSLKSVREMLRADVIRVEKTTLTGSGGNFYGQGVVESVATSYASGCISWSPWTDQKEGIGGEVSPGVVKIVFSLDDKSVIDGDRTILYASGGAEETALSIKSLIPVEETNELVALCKRR